MEDRIMKKLENIEDRLMKLETSSERLDNHITFVEYVYNKLKMTKVLTFFSGSGSTKQIDDSGSDDNR